MSSYTCRHGYCTSIYGHPIYGSRHSVATACAMDSNCKAFRHSNKNGFGYLCNDNIRKKGYSDWNMCGFWSGNFNFLFVFKLSNGKKKHNITVKSIIFYYL